jgi:hypothetical protein
VWFSVSEVSGVLPEGDWYHRGYPAGYMGSNDTTHLPRRLREFEPRTP